MDPSKPFQHEITASLKSLEAKNVTLKPPQKWGFQANKDPLKQLFWTHRAPVMAFITKSRRLTYLSGPIDPFKPFLQEITVTLESLEAKNVTLSPPQTWGFQAENDALKRSYWIH